jgi:integrase
MSLYKDPRSPFWQFDFWWRGYRFHGSTKATTRREAEKVEAAERERAKQHVAQTEAARTSLRLDDVAGRYWQEVGQHHAGARNTWRELNRLIEFFGKDRLLTEITGDDVTKLVAWRRGHRVRDKLVSPFTVNATTKQVRKLFVRAKLWGVRFNHEPRWSQHLLKEPQERVRKLAEHEAARLDAVIRDDLSPFFAFARASGLRLHECLLRWDEVKWGVRQIIKPGKGGKTVTVPITSAIREILWPLRGQHPEHVFTFIAARTMRHRAGKRIKGERYPLTYNGVRDAWWRLRKRSGVTGFRFHDFRHDLATKILRETGNLKLVQRALNHSDIKTTVRYAHVLDHEVAEALERVTKPRSGPRTTLRKII